MYTNTTVELMLENVFSTQAVQSGNKEDKWGNLVTSQLTES
jgi:hypothetical protein